MKSPRRWNRLSKSTRRRIEYLVRVMQAHDRTMRRVQRGWVAPKPTTPETKGPIS